MYPKLVIYLTDLIQQATKSHKCIHEQTRYKAGSRDESASEQILMKFLW